MNDNISTHSIDLNRNTSDIPNMEKEFDEHDFDSSSVELRRTVEVSKELGFDIKVDNPILKEVMGGEGDQIVSQ